MYTKQVSTVLKGVVIYARNVEKSAGFYSNALGLKITNQSTQLVELKDATNAKIILKRVDGEAFANKGYSPLLNFQVDDIAKTIEAIKTYGGTLDGEVIEEGDTKIACLRAPDGEMIGLFEGEIMESSESGYTMFFGEAKGLLEHEEVPSAADKTTEEIKNILRKIQF